MSSISCVMVGELFFAHGWDVAHLWQWLPELQIFPSEKDQIVWKGSFTGNFTVASAFEGLRAKRNYSLVDKLVWSSIIP